VSKVGWREYIDYHDTPGFIINSLSNSSLHSLSFTLLEKSSLVGVVIKFLYLKSYTGMGAVAVNLCEKTIAPVVDALYHDHATFKYSLPTQWIYIIKEDDEKRCLALCAEERMLEIAYNSLNDEFAAVRETHHQKFKLLSAQVCSPAKIL